MAQPLAKTHQDQLKRVKKNVEDAREFFSENYRRFNEFRRFVFSSTLDSEDIATLKELQKPILEFNILEPYVSRLCGEFSKQEPQIEVSTSHETPVPVDVQTINVVDGIIRDRMDDARKQGYTYEVFKDLMSGGFSVLEVYTEYEPGKTFNQNFKIRRVYDPTMTGFDPMAEKADKSDGQYAFYLYPRYLEDFKVEHPDVADIDNLSFTKNTGFNWSYRTADTKKILLVCEYYEKKPKSVKIVRLADNTVITAKQYQEMLTIYKERQILGIPPIIVDERYMETSVVHRYTFIENQVIEHEETDFSDLPLVFVDGNSIKLRQGKDGQVEQITRPYLYHARDIQRLKNFAGQTLANELENMIQHKFKVAEESIPAEYRDAYENVQQADVLIYKAFKDDNADQPLPPPMEIQRTPIPPEVTSTFSLTDQMTQNILGSFDIQMGNLNKSQLSGLAIQESVTQSNATAMPFVVGYLQALTQIANIIVNLIPKYFKTPRTVPVLSAEGKRSYVRINDQSPGGVSTDYPDNALQVCVEAGVNFSIQKTRALQQIIAMMQASPLFAQFMNTEGLPILLDNLEIRGIDQLKLLSEAFVQKTKAMQAKAQNQPNPLMVKAQTEQVKAQIAQGKLQLEEQQAMADNQFRTAEIMNDKDANTTERLKVILAQQQAGVSDAVQLQKAKAEMYNDKVEMALKTADQHHEHALAIHDQLHRHTKEALELENDSIDLAHQIHQANKPQPIEANQNG